MPGNLKSKHYLFAEEAVGSETVCDVVMFQQNPFFKRWFHTRLSTTQFLLLVLSGVILDQITKWIVVRNFAPGESIDLAVVALHYVQNTGASFSLLPNAIVFLTVFSSLVIAIIFFSYKKIDTRYRLFFAFVLAGAIGNFIDRFRLGYVVDFIDFKIWPVFNVADIFVSLGAISLLYVVMKSE